MAKISINSNIKNITLNEEYIFNGFGILNNNKIIYKDKDSVNEIVIESDEITLLKKRTDGVKMKFCFKNNTSNFIDVIGDDYSITIPLLTEKVYIEKNKIEIFYQIDLNERFSFCLIYE